MKAVDIRCFPAYEAVGTEADELRRLAAEALDDHLGVETGPDWDPAEEAWFAQGDAGHSRD